MKKVIVAGAAGRMGGTIIALIPAYDELRLVGAVEVPGHPKVGIDLGQSVHPDLAGVRIEDDIDKLMEKCDVVISFATPDGSLEHLRSAAEHGKSAVIGTTGFSAEQMDEIRRLCQQISCVLAPNMSVGINVLYKVVEELAKMLGESYDVEIIEAHHRMKKDAPSGTALKIAGFVAKALGVEPEKASIFSRHGMVGERPRKSIGILSVRGGDIIAEHTVLFAGIGDRIEITHRAHNRNAFASGALKAAAWVVGKPPGLYDMMDVLGLSK